MAAEHETLTSETAKLERITDLLGGDRVLKHRIKRPLDVHDTLVHGLPGEAVVHLVGQLVTLHDFASLEKAVGMSLRTFQRRKKAVGMSARISRRRKSSPAKVLSQEQSGRTWRFAEILARAIAVLGSQEEAEEWLERPATGLDQRRPIDLLATPAGAKIVEDHLERLEYGVYA
jgi:uncharacterized protein (DUF2384 family)